MSVSAVGIFLFAAVGGIGCIALVLYTALKKRNKQSNSLGLIGALLGGLVASVLVFFLLAPAHLGTSTSNTTDSPASSNSAAASDAEVSFSTSWSNQLLTGGALALLVALAYLFLDAGTRGRYTWPLRIGAVAMFSGLCFALWKFGLHWL